MEEFDIEALLSSNEKTIIRLLEDYANVNNIIAYVIDNNGDLKSSFFGNLPTDGIFEQISEMKNLNKITEKHQEYNLSYADAALRVSVFGQIVGKVCCIEPANRVNGQNFGMISYELGQHSRFLKRLIESVGHLLINEHGIGNFMIKYPLEVDDIIDELNDDDSVALQQLRHLSTSNDSIISAIEYIDDNLDKHLTLDQVSNHVFLSDYYFSKLFKRETKLSFSVYLNARKIQKAMMILKQTSHSISEVSEELGFTRMSYFSQTFKKYTGYTPSDFRNEEYLEI
ncbi:helix-turn-helix transcriptional regulator [Companilactobacillus mishanensis]|uniref:helix-turn-helix transcriptional regulator n=1 Tax=Companilactobacillus mishanensis TaxID=2486008 RepID=UPI001296A205|nr:AraC family transcriptional regulator [Companilactobacillus mishanensis]MQS89268.1 helix-turn-helix transcriptional regulator [Companilactobacillus mishanensis]